MPETYGSGMSIIEAKTPEILAEKMRRNFAAFIHNAWKVVDPYALLVWNWHIDQIAEYLMMVSDGEIKRLIFNMPPRHTKSRLVTVMWPVWEWISSPHLSYLFSSYSMDLARDHSRERRNIIESPWYQYRWGDRYWLVTDQNRVTYFANNAGGRMRSRGTGTGSTGQGGNRIIIDDPHNTKQSESEVQRKAAIDDFRQNLSTRLNRPREDAIVVVMQRLHAQDLTGWLLAEELDFEHVVVQFEATERQVITLPRSGRQIVREQGDLLCPERMGREEAEIQKRGMGTYGYNAQYQQQPIPAGGNRIKVEWFPRHKVLPEHTKRRVQSWDTANKKGKLNADTVCHTFVEGKDGQWYWAHTVKEQLNYPELKAKAMKMADDWLPTAILIEDKASGTSLIQELRKIRKDLPIIAVEPDNDKETRMDVETGKLEAGMVSLPEWAYWLADVENDIQMFPDLDRWDIIDALSQFLHYQFGHKGEIKMVRVQGV